LPKLSVINVICKWRVTSSCFWSRWPVNQCSRPGLAARLHCVMLCVL